MLFDEDATLLSFFERYPEDFDLTPDEENAMIGKIYLNVYHLEKVYREMRFDDDGVEKDDCNLLSYLKKIKILLLVLF